MPTSKVWGAFLVILWVGSAAGALARASDASEPETESASANDDDTSETRVRPDTGRVLRGTIVARTDGAVPREQLLEPDPEALAQVERLRERLELANPRDEVRPLEQVPVTGPPPGSHPPSEFGPPQRGIDTPDAFTFYKNTIPSGAAPMGFSSAVNEPSAVAVGHDVLYTGNWYAASSTDRGDSFSYLDPFSGPFAPPASSPGFCCDQVTAYDPGTDAIFFLQQYVNSATTGVQRINVDTGADGTWDCFYNITPQVMGFAADNWLDFPDLAAGETFLYHSSNVFTTDTFAFTGAFTARYPLASMGTCAGGVPFDVYTDASFFSFKLTRGATNTMYFADHVSTASLRIWGWTDAAAAPTSVDRAVTSWSNATRVCPDPDGRDFCGFIDSRLGGAFVADGVVGFMWVPAQDGLFPLPYTRIARFDQATLTLLDEPIVWSGALAWVYPSVAVNGNGDLGGTILAGGTGLHMSCLAWLADDVNGDAIAPLENQIAGAGITGPTTNRAGDYSSAHAYHPYDLLHSGACYVFDSTTSGQSRFTIFGREAPCSADPLVLTEDYNDLAGAYRSDSSITAQSGFEVSAALAVEMLARDLVAFENGFAVTGGGDLAVHLDDTLDCTTP